MGRNLLNPLLLAPSLSQVRMKLSDRLLKIHPETEIF